MHRLFLIGYRGSGKSTVARLLAERLGWASIDSDDEVEREAGKSIAAMFAEDGEPAFRDLEERVVASLCNRDKTVIALGGGAVLREASRRRMTAAGQVVYLTAPAATLAARIAGDATTASRRPSLTGLAGLEEVERVLAVREPIYRECATVAIDVDGRAPEAIADEIVGHFQVK
ncbi:shikimate kinase [Botrimarina mediterranea]|uniref:Shikimate kinase n=1 Tax=Botrimarina mediterranea TaxID=2528022 RepID=A0A518KB19_9BACT|nr:shikimate kinase [Botrimarina mediterranea]QDV74991.1 Shikimate kinase 2 [Botrimarina mediterranea]QDV79638.1 Shikimate kinase 2 [Planctomycetes bacterium K2D]